MRIPNPFGLCALVAVPLIAAMYWLRPRPPSRGIAGLFLWTQAARQNSRVAAQPAHVTISAALDIAAACLLVALAGGLVTAEFDSDSLFRYWSTIATRILLCIAVATLLVYLWKSSGVDKASS